MLYLHQYLYLYLHQGEKTKTDVGKATAKWWINAAFMKYRDDGKYKLPTWKSHMNIP